MKTIKAFNGKRITTMLLCLAISLAVFPQSLIEHPWKGKRIAYFGDSISDPNHKAAKKHFWNFLNEWLGTTSYVYAVSGRQWNDIPNQADKLKKQHGDDFDAIIIFIGTNDFNAGIPIGQWYTETTEDVEAAVHAPRSIVKRKKRTLVMDNGTYCGRINIAMDKLKKMYPNKQIVLLTPIHRAYANFSDTNIQPTEAYQNCCGEYFDKYVKCVKEAGNIWSVPVIDLNSLCGLYPLEKEQLIYFNNKDTDQLHPNALGQERMAKTILWQLSALPCTF